MSVHASRSDSIPSSTTGAISIVPPTMSAGDVVVGAIVQDIASGGGSALPTSWTPMASSPLTSTVDGQVMCCGYRYESGTPPANYSWTAPGADCVVGQVTLTGANFASPLNASTGSASGATAQSGTTVNVPNPGFSISPTQTNDLLFLGSADWVAPVAGVTPGIPAGFTVLESLVVADQFASIDIAVKTNQASGSTGTVQGTSTQTNSTSAGFTAFLVAVDLSVPMQACQWDDHDRPCPSQFVGNGSTVATMRVRWSDDAFDFGASDTGVDNVSRLN